MSAVLDLNKVYLVGLFLFLTACAPFYQENLYGNGHYPPPEGEQTELSSEAEPFDYQAFQANFLSINVTQVSYSLTQTLSYITLKGTCFNPGFETTSIYYQAFDVNGNDLANDGYPYLSNKVYYHGTSKLQPVVLTCSEKGLWSTVVEVPTAILYQLDKGTLEVSIVTWYKGQELHNDAAGVSSFTIAPPFPEEEVPAGP